MYLGSLLASGHTLADILDMSWDQIALSAESVARYRVSVMDEIFSPIVAMLGGKYKSGSVTTPKRTGKNQGKPKSKAKAEQDFVSRLASLGVLSDD